MPREKTYRVRLQMLKSRSAFVRVKAKSIRQAAEKALAGDTEPVPDLVEFLDDPIDAPVRVMDVTEVLDA
jgi:hypothetical protein